MLKKIQDSRKLLRALDNLTNETKLEEEHLADELHLFFQYLGRQVLANVDLENPLETVFYGYATDTINKLWEEYYKILRHYVDKAAIIGNFHYEILLNASADRARHFESTKARNTDRTFLDNELNATDTDELFAPNPKVASHLDTYTFEASEKTKARVNKEINDILGQGYREGWGPRDVAQKIQARFQQLSDYEARRIAQTEINTTRNMVQYDRLVEDEMPYKIWHAAHDSRTRKSHLDVDEEIVPIDQPFSNGLMYPGDKSGKIEEWVNCRCSHAAYIMPLGYEAPNFYPFTESDLVKVGSSLSQDYVPQIQQKLQLLQGAMLRDETTEDVPVREVVPYAELIIGIYDTGWSKVKKQQYVSTVLESLPKDVQKEEFIATLKELYPKDKFVQGL